MRRLDLATPHRIESSITAYERRPEGSCTAGSVGLETDSASVGSVFL